MMGYYFITGAILWCIGIIFEIDTTNGKINRIAGLIAFTISWPVVMLIITYKLLQSNNEGK